MTLGTYKHDVFISFSHRGEWVDWLEEWFITRFRHHLGNELGNREPDVYVAKHQMHGGDIWPLELAKHHARSRSLLALCTKPYRCSPWCQLEFAMMRQREEIVGLRTSGNECGLIVPVIAHDCDDSPAFLAGIQPISIVGLTYRYLSKESREAQKLDQKIEEIAVSVAKVIIAAPGYDPSWLDLNCDGFLKLFEEHQTTRSQRTPPR